MFRDEPYRLTSQSAPRTRIFSRLGFAAISAAIVVVLPGCPNGFGCGSNDGPDIPTPHQPVPPRPIIFSQGGNIYGINPDGTGQADITQTIGFEADIEEEPDYNATGDRIAYSVLSGTFYSLGIMNADGTNRRLIGRDGPSFFPSQPRWSRAGTRIIHTRIPNRTGVNEGDLWLIDAGGQNPVQLTTDSADDRDGAFSPDGTRVVFSSKRDGDYEIYRMNAAPEATNNRPQKLTNNSVEDSDPVYNPGGTQIAFTSNRDGNGEIYVMNADGTSVRRLTNNPGPDQHPAWSPDGRQIVYSSERGGVTNLYILDVNNPLQPRQLTTFTRGFVGNPSWVNLPPVNVFPTPTPTAQATATPRPTPTPIQGGTQQTVNLSAQSRSTVKRLASGGVQSFNDIMVVGDHESNGDGALQGFSAYSLASIPAGATIRSARLSVLQNQQLFQGNPFGLGSLFAERATSVALNEGTLQNGAVRVSNNPAGFTSVDVTSLVQQARSQNSSNIIFRFRFEQVRNNNRQNDNADINTGGLEVTYIR